MVQVLLSSDSLLAVGELANISAVRTRPAGVNAAGDPVHSHGIVFEKFAPEVREQLAEMLRPS